MDNFVSILNNSEISLEIKKSKFIGFSFFIENELEAQKIISNYCKQFADATHVCYSYVLNSIEKCSDNGEPSGTAGKPMLEIIKKMELKNVLVIVVRYFGGVKLGAGGLNRAYGDTAKQTLVSSGKAEYNACNNYKFTFNLGVEDKMFNKFYLNQVNVNSKYYSNLAVYEVSIFKQDCAKVLNDISETVKRNNYYTFLNSNYIKKEI